MSADGTMNLTLEALVPTFAVCKTRALPLDSLDGPFVFFARTEEECSLVCPEVWIPKEALACERGWRGFRVPGTLDFALVGILARLTAVMAEAGVSVFAVSTYDTDYLFVKQADVRVAEAAWQAAGIAIRPAQG